MEITDIDLNQLVVFQQLIAQQRVSKVAESLGLTQPAVSNTLARLRRKFGDELFVRTPGGMVPTAFAEQLAEPVGQALALIQAGLNPHTRFDPASDPRTVTIAMTDIGEIIFLPALVERLRREAPGISLQTVPITATSLRADMEAGKVDLAIGPLPQLQAGFFQRQLFRQRYVCLFRRGHALDRKRLALAAFQAAEHLVVVSAGTGHGQVEERMRRAGVQRTVRLSVPHFASVGHLLHHTEMVATVTERLAECLAEPFDLRFRAPPIDLPDIAINVFWHARVHRSPAHQWLRGVLFELFGKGAALLPRPPTPPARSTAPAAA